MTDTVLRTSYPNERYCIAGPIDHPYRIRLHLLDLDNLHRGPCPTEAAMHLVRADYGRIGYGPHDLGYAAFNHAPHRHPSPSQSRAFQLQQLWGPLRLRPAQGPDGADLRLIEDAESFIPAQESRSRFTDVIIGSGDHIFAPLAFRFQKAGITVHTVVPSPKSLSFDLRAATNGCIWLLDGGRCQRHSV